MRPLRLVPAVLGAVPVVAAAACYGPTSMRVEVLTDLTCQELPHAAIYNGGDSDPLGETSDCVAADTRTQTLGDLLFAPHSDRSATVTVKVQMAVGPNADPKRCKSTPDQCVFASRKFTYVEHEASRLSVRLYRDCLGKVCGDGKTCVQGGECVDETVSCSGGSCGVAQEKPFVATQDAGAGDAAPVDASAPDATPDAGMACLPPNGATDFAQASALPLSASTPSSVYWAGDNTLRKLDMQSGAVTVYDTADTNFTMGALGARNAEPWSVRHNTLQTASVVYDGTNVVGNSIGARPTVMTVAPTSGAGTTDTAYVAMPTGIIALSPGHANTQIAALSPVSALSYDAQYLLALVSGTVSRVPFPNGMPTVVSDAVEAIGTNGTVALAAKSVGGIWKINEGAPPTVTQLTTTFAAAASELAVDATHVYWVENVGNAYTLYRFPLDGSAAKPVPVFAPTTVGVTIEHLAVDAPANGCVYYWTKAPGSTVYALRATRKAP